MIKSFKNIKIIPSAFDCLNRYLDGGFKPNSQYLIIGNVDYYRITNKIKIELTYDENPDVKNEKILRNNCAEHQKGFFEIRYCRTSNNALVVIFVTSTELDTNTLENLTENTNFERIIGVYDHKMFKVLNHSERWEDFD